MNEQLFLAYEKLDSLIFILKKAGFEVKAPVVDDGSIVYDTIDKASQLPWGYVDEQKEAFYSIKKTDSQRAFGWTLPVQSIKPLLFEEREVLWNVKRNDQGKLSFEKSAHVAKYAIFGVRPCDLRAIEIQDKVFIDNTYHDLRYQKRRQQLFIIAANCTSCHHNCFCVSLGDKPQADRGFDMAMTEVEGGFVVEVGSQTGESVVDQLQLVGATKNQIEQAAKQIAATTSKQVKKVPEVPIMEETLKQSLDHAQWDDVAKRCLSCGSCTQACPTCFCHTEKDEPKLNGEETEHLREWDSCFGLDHSYTHGELYREQPKYRYRQWLVHKFGTWRDQFDTKGCVGCGRCITWCPVKIDVTEEINAICGE
ncbi:4Fe-4S dicluster domain-containing protein [Thiotrichales bacterium 19S3-7]|nr:4Fe-4S dicluster domain-containing protein [Thiotrichales bacterium 19S3-7]MCF6802061.1 4Fe-4S dicluster domain-containing protein [Thiotrichales bacterium 19S3-11]